MPNDLALRRSELPDQQLCERRFTVTVCSNERDATEGLLDSEADIVEQWGLGTRELVLHIVEVDQVAESAQGFGRGNSNPDSRFLFLQHGFGSIRETARRARSADFEAQG